MSTTSLSNQGSVLVSTLKCISIAKCCYMLGHEVERVVCDFEMFVIRFELLWIDSAKHYSKRSNLYVGKPTLMFLC